MDTSTNNGLKQGHAYVPTTVLARGAGNVMLKKPMRHLLLLLLRRMFPSKASVVVFVCIVVPAWIWLICFIVTAFQQQKG